VADPQRHPRLTRHRRRELAQRLAGIVAGIMAVCLPTLALAQVPPSPNAIQQPVLEEIVVTATRRPESVATVPVSIVALSQAQLSQSNLKSMADIAAVTPGVQLALPYGSYATVTTLAIRGMNTSTGASVVGVYLDDTPIQTRLSTLNNVGNPYPGVFDLNRVEIERGPQGTLFGAGSEAGTVRFITNQPSLTKFSGFARSEIASTDYGTLSYEAGAAGGGPIVENSLGFRASVWYRHDGGYIDMVYPWSGAVAAQDQNQNNKLVLRTAFTYQPAEIVDITPAVFYQRSVGNESDFFYGNFSNPSAGKFGNGRLLPDSLSDYFTVSSLKIEAHLALGDLVSTTSYMRRNASGELDNSPVLGEIGIVDYGNPLGPGFPASPDQVSPFFLGHGIRAFTQEVRFASRSPEAHVSWVAGVFYDHRSQDDTIDQYSLAVDPTGASIGKFNQVDWDKQIAAYGQADFHLTRQWTLTAGVRVSHVTTDQLNENGTGYLNSGTPSTATTTLSENPTTPRVALSYQADRNNLFYASASKGFRVGAGNAPVASFCNATIPSTVHSDYVWSYEVGAKDTVLDGRLRTETSFYWVDWSKIQQLIAIPSCGGYYGANAGSAVSKGFDLGLQALITERLIASLDLAYVDAYYTKNVYDTAGNPLIRSGDKLGTLPQVNPPWDVYGTLTYTRPLLQNLQLRLRGEYEYHSRNSGPFTTQIVNSISYLPSLVPDPPIHLFNARLVIANEKLEGTLFLQNVFNSHPLLGMTQDTPTTNLINYRTLRPRTVGLSVDMNF
jgi:iron complex outermembrane receptor protein